MAKKKITEIATDELAGFLDDNGYELYNAEFVKEAKDWFLRVYIDWKYDESADGQTGETKYIGTDDCEKVSRYLSERLDALDPIEKKYYLEVSSPGLDRTLLREKDYGRYAGKEVEVKLYKARDGKKTFSGTLKGLIGDKIVIMDEKGNETEFPVEQAASVKLKIAF